MLSTSAVWDLENRGLVLPCLVQGLLLDYRTTTGEAEEVDLGDRRRPAMIRRYHDDFVVELGDGFLKVFREGSRVVEELDLLKASHPNWTVGSIRDWYITTREIFAFADLQAKSCESPDETCVPVWKFAFIRLEREVEPRFDVLWIDEIATDSRFYTLLLNSYITEVSGEVFALLPGESTEILWVNGNTADRMPVPAALSKALDVAKFDKGDQGNSYQEIEIELSEQRSRDRIFPTSLVGWNGKLYVLYRGTGPTYVGPVRWWLAQLAPGPDPAILGYLQVPSNSPRILVVPGRENWAVVEHPRVGSADNRGVQRPNRLKLWNYRKVEYAFSPVAGTRITAAGSRHAQSPGT